MSTDISRVYAFLAKQGDWVNEADKNGDDQHKDTG